VDRRDTETGLLAMQRTVGFTASIGAQLLLRGDIRARGLLSPVPKNISSVSRTQVSRCNLAALARGDLTLSRE
jgi:saccharopine dehydrogenase-like NADP-dependent oxidoreductase